MSRSQSNLWFEFGSGKSSDSDKGVLIMDPFSETTPSLRGSQMEAAGRDGYVWVSDDSYKPISQKIRCRCRNSKKRAVMAWLYGSGHYRNSQYSDAQFDARIIKEIDFEQITPDSDPLLEFTVEILLQPHPYVYPASAAVTVDTSGAAVNNAGTYIALPKVVIVGSGDFSVTIGQGSSAKTMYFHDVPSGGVIVDSLLQDTLDSTGANLMTDKVSGEYFELAPGTNTVQWLTPTADDEKSGTVSSVTITRRERWF